MLILCRCALVSGQSRTVGDPPGQDVARMHSPWRHVLLDQAEAQPSHPLYASMEWVSRLRVKRSRRRRTDASTGTMSAE